ncbi:MAG: DUF3313 domain-containing protein [Planctomycetes bacterium]|nr:DUF3313 domain-containing protein [Planctomycetota bacterium]
MNKVVSKSTCKNLLLILVFIVVSACGSPKPTKTGFLDNYSQLSPSPHVKGAYTYFNPEDTLGDYSKFIIEPVHVVLTPEEEEKIGHDELKEMAEYFRTQIILQLGDRYAVVKNPGPGIARVRVAITDVNAAKRYLNIHPMMIASGVGLGGACMEGEVVDSVSGERIAAVIDCEKGGRGLAGLTKYEQSEQVLKAWAERFRMRLDEAHQAR